MIDYGPGRTRANFVYLQFLASKKLAKISQVPNFGGGRIGRTCFNQTFPDRQVRHKIYRGNSTLHVLFFFVFYCFYLLTIMLILQFYIKKGNKKGTTHKKERKK